MLSLAATLFIYFLKFQNQSAVANVIQPNKKKSIRRYLLGYPPIWKIWICV